MSAYTVTWPCPHCHARNSPAETECHRCGVTIAPGGDGA